MRLARHPPIAITLALVAACASHESVAPAPDSAKDALNDGRWQDALDACAPGDASRTTCDKAYCALIARTMLFVDELDAYLLPTFRAGNLDPANADLGRLVRLDELLADAARDVATVTDNACSYSLDHLPLLIGDASDPIVRADVRGVWSTRSAQLVGAIIASVRYLFAAATGAATVPPGDPSGVPGLPTLLEEVRARIAAHDARLWSEPADPASHRGGWLDRDGDGAPSKSDELLIDLFSPGTDERIYDFSSAELVRGELLPLGALTPTPALPPARCAYRKWHVDTLFESTDVGTTDGMSFSPDGARLAFPMRVDGTYQVHVANADGSGATCITCGGAVSWNDGVRWRPDGTSLVFISNRDHRFSIGGSGGGAGQELYAMRPDGTQATRLTTSHAWATNYHVNWSNDGKRIVWGSTESRAWDVMVADFVDDASGMRIENARRLVHDTTWWETHGFSHDDSAVITTNTRAGFQSADIYAIDVATGSRTRLTNDLAWDEHAHLSPDGRALSWISARWRKAAMTRMTDGSLSPVFDFFWIAPAIFFTFENPPAGFSTELTLMDADGTNIRALTADDEVVADNQWSPDATRIVFRQTPTKTHAPAKLRVLTFDDCP